MFRRERKVRGEARVVSQFPLVLDNRVRRRGRWLSALHGPDMLSISELGLRGDGFETARLGIHLLFQLHLLRCTLLICHLLSEVADLLVVPLGDHNSRLFSPG